MPLNSSLSNKRAQLVWCPRHNYNLEEDDFVTGFSEITNKSVIAEGGGTIQDFDMFALDYDNDIGTFLSNTLRDKYDGAKLSLHR
jgi:hypothetical protein